MHINIMQSSRYVIPAFHKAQDCPFSICQFDSAAVANVSITINGSQVILEDTLNEYLYLLIQLYNTGASNTLMCRIITRLSSETHLELSSHQVANTVIYCGGFKVVDKLA